MQPLGVAEAPVREARTRLPGRSRIKRWHIVGAVAIVAAGVGASAVLLTRNGPSETASTQLKFASVSRTDLISVRSLDAEVVARGEGPRVLGRLSGTLTDIAAERSTVERGQTLYAIDGEPVILLYGALPAWRDIGPDVPNGADVRQLEENLDVLGFSPGDVDERFTAETRSAVNEWLSSVGLPETGVVRLGRVVFLRAALTVADHLKNVGAPIQDGDEIMSALSFEKVVTVSFSNENDLATGERVTVALPGKKVPGKVTSVVTDPGAGRGEELFLLATVVPDEAGALAELREGADVDVEVFDASRENVLAIPVTALLARDRGGYAVEVDRGAGRVELVGVTPGLYANDLVEIRSGLREGDRVVVP
jgi:peptidoglycan hydrolase-like protein with peptidoglycan-binding domain